MSDLPARFAIYRKSRPHPVQQYLGVADNGRAAWLGDWTSTFTFDSFEAAEDFIGARLGEAADDARVERHTIH